MTTSLPHTQIRLRDLSELVAGIPYIIGFPPTNSLVLFTFHRCPELVLSTTLRVDLPKPEHASLVATEVSTAVARSEVETAIAVVVGDSGAEHGKLIDMLRKALAEKEIMLTHAFWVPKVAHGEQWQCYDDPLCADVVPDPQTSALAAAAAVAGETAYPSREAIVAHLAADPEEMLARRKALLTAYRPSPAQPYTEDDACADLELLGYALDMATKSYDPPTLTDHQLVRLALAMSETTVKDECMAIALSEEAMFAERLWTTLVRALPSPERAEPAFLLAMSAYLRGAGVLAALALKIVMESNPLHGTAVLLDYALARGVPPNDLRTLLMTSILNNNEEQADAISIDDDDDPPWDISPEQPGLATTSVSSDRFERMPLNYMALRPGSVHSRPSMSPTPTEGVLGHSLWKPVRPSPVLSVVPRVVADEEEKSSWEGWFAGTPAMFSPSVGFESGIANGTEPVAAAVPPGVGEVEAPRVAPGPVSQRSAEALGIHGDEPVTATVTMDPLTAFLPPPTERSGPV